MSIDGKSRKSPTSFCARRPGLYNPPKKLESKRGSKHELFEINDLDMNAKPRGHSTNNQAIPHSSKQLALIKSSLITTSPDDQRRNFGKSPGEQAPITKTTQSNTMASLSKAQFASGHGSKYESSVGKKEKSKSKPKGKTAAKSSTGRSSPLATMPTTPFR